MPGGGFGAGAGGGFGRGFGATLAVLVAALGAVLATALAAPAGAAGAPDITQLTLSSGQFRLTDTDYEAATGNLYSAYLTHHVDLTGVITTDFTQDSAGKADGWLGLRSMRGCSGSSETGALPPVTTSTAWCWSSAYSDDTTAHWYPQGLSTTGTADGSDGAISGDRVIAVSWHYALVGNETSAGCKTKNVVKVTFIDRDTGKYRHVLLVEPTSTGAGASDFDFVTGHGGGIAWYSHYLYVTDTTHGIRVFDLDKMARVDDYGSSVTTVGMHGGRSSACGYPYVLPEVHRYFQSGTPTSCDGTSIDPAHLCFSWLSLDKTGGTPYKLVTGEWYGSVNGARIVRYGLNPASSASSPGLLTTSGGASVVQDAWTADRYDGLQGGMTWTDSSGVLNFDLHKGCGTSPGVFSHTWVGDTRATTTCASGGNWAAGTPQALSYWPVLGTTHVDELWGLTEQPGQRTVFAVGFTDPAVQDRH